MDRPFLIFFILVGLALTSCKESFSKSHHKEKQQATAIDSSIVYQSESLIVTRLSNHIYAHISFLDTNDFGKVACNGMLVINENEAIVFDTPTDDNSSQELIEFITKELESEISAIIPTHFHDDCVGGIKVFEEYNIPIYARNQTIEFLKSNGQHFSQPISGFTDNLSLYIGNQKIYVKYFGEGHTKDNVIGYFPEDNTIFGGCLIKEIGASKGYLGDANLDQWSETVRKIKLEYPEAKIIIPGHGKWGGTELLDYTIELFKKR